MDNNTIDQSAVATTVSNGIEYTFIEDFLVKPLDPIMVKKEFKVPVSKGESTDETGTTATDYDDVTTEVKEVESDFREGVVLKVSERYKSWIDDEKVFVHPINVGDIVVYKAISGRYFDLFKDSVMLKSYDIVAVKTK